MTDSATDPSIRPPFRVHSGWPSTTTEQQKHNDYLLAGKIGNERLGLNKNRVKERNTLGRS